MRTARRLSEGNIYHVIQRGTGKQLIFEDDEDRRAFISMLLESLENYSVEMYCWCLMDNHFHALLHGDIDEISLAMKQCCGRYAMRFNARHGRIGHLFQERFKSEPIDSDSYLLTVVRYIHQNPEKAGMESTQSWPWSSYREYVGLLDGGTCALDFVLSCFGGRDSFIRFHAIPCESSECMDVFALRNETRTMSDAQAIAIAEGLYGRNGLASLKSLRKDLRNEALSELRDAGLSIRQIERLTGIGRGIIARAEKRDK